MPSRKCLHGLCFEGILSLFEAAYEPLVSRSCHVHAMHDKVFTKTVVAGTLVCSQKRRAAVAPWINCWATPGQQLVLVFHRFKKQLDCSFFQTHFQVLFYHLSGRQEGWFSSARTYPSAFHPAPPRPRLLTHNRQAPRRLWYVWVLDSTSSGVLEQFHNEQFHTWKHEQTSWTFSSEARTNEILCKPMEERNQRLTRG